MATAEVISISQPQVSAPPESAMIYTFDLWKTYDMGSEQQVHALRGVSLEVQEGERVVALLPVLALIVAAFRKFMFIRDVSSLFDMKQIV